MSKPTQYYGIPRDSNDIVTFPKADSAVAAYREYLEISLPVAGTAKAVPTEFSLFLSEHELHVIYADLLTHLSLTGEKPEKFFISFRTMSAVISETWCDPYALAGPIKTSSLEAVLNVKRELAVG